jgi:vacuolar-type H+-ATPase subunit E/Vma4
VSELVEREAALEPLRTALIARAYDDAGRARASAEADGRQTVAAAREQAAALLAGARAQGEADAAALQAVERSRSRRDARSVVLQTQRAAYDQLREQARQAVRHLLDDPVWRQRLITAVRRQLGEQAELCPQPDGGIIARTPDGRSIDTSVDALVDHALADLDLEQLWTAS